MSATNLSSDSCFDDAAQSWLPNDKVFCGANFGWSDEDVQLNLPGFYPASSFAKRGSEIWLSDEDNGLKSWLGCGNHPGLVNGSRYCAQTSSNLDVGSITGDWGVLEDVSTVACYAYSVSEQAISVSFDPPLNLLLFHLFGYTFAPNAEVALLDYMGSDLQLKTGETTKAQLAYWARVSLTFGTFVLELELPIEGVFGMDFRSDSGVVQPQEIMSNLVWQNSTLTGWQMVIQVFLQPQINLLGFEIQIPVASNFQVLFKATESSWPDIYLSGFLYHAKSMSDLLGGLPNLGAVCAANILPKVVIESPFCHGEDAEEEEEAEVSFYFTLEKGTAVVDFRAWGMLSMLHVGPHFQVRKDL